MKNYRYVLFDLDGTLTESGEGIINSAVGGWASPCGGDF